MYIACSIGWPSIPACHALRPVRLYCRFPSPSCRPLPRRARVAYTAETQKTRRARREERHGGGQPIADKGTMAGAGGGVSRLDVRRRRDRAVPVGRPGGPARPLASHRRAAGDGLDEPDHRLLSGRGRHRRRVAGLARRQDRPRARHGRVHVDVFDLHGPVLFRHDPLADGGVHFPGGAGDGRRVVVGRRPGRRVLARTPSPQAGRHHRRGVQRRPAVHRGRGAHAASDR